MKNWCVYKEHIEKLEQRVKELENIVNMFRPLGPVKPRDHFPPAREFGDDISRELLEELQTKMDELRKKTESFVAAVGGPALETKGFLLTVGRTRGLFISKGRTPALNLYQTTLRSRDSYESIHARSS